MCLICSTLAKWWCDYANTTQVQGEWASFFQEAKCLWTGASNSSLRCVRTPQVYKAFRLGPGRGEEAQGSRTVEPWKRGSGAVGCASPLPASPPTAASRGFVAGGVREALGLWVWGGVEITLRLKFLLKSHLPSGSIPCESTVRMSTPAPNPSEVHT